MLGGAAFAQRTVDNAAQILGDDRGENLFTVALVQDIALIGTLFLFRLFQRQQLHGCGRLGKDGDEIGIRNDDLVKFSCQKSLAYLLGDGEAVTHGQFGRFGVVLRKGRDLLAPEIVQSLLADGQDYGVLASDLRLNQLENVAVVAAGKTAVTGNDDIQCFFHRTLL